jgi:hypothetical protein
MRQVFKDRPLRVGQLSRLRGTAPAYLDTEDMAWRLGGENEAAPDLCLPVLPEPEIVDGEILWGASVTIKPVARLDAECAWEPRDVPPLPVARGVEPTYPVAVDVAAWLEGLGEPMTVEDLAELTGHDRDLVARACQEWRWTGKIAKQQTNDEPLYLWRRAPL